MESVYDLNTQSLKYKFSCSHGVSECLEKCSVLLNLFILGPQLLISYSLIMLYTYCVLGILLGTDRLW